MFPRYNLALESQVMLALAEHTPVPTPGVALYEPDPEPLGGPVVVMKRIDGRVPSDDPPFAVAGWVHWEVLAATKFSVIMHRAGELMIAAGQLPLISTMRLNNPASQLVARLLGLPEPAGLTQRFIGNRGVPAAS